MNIPNHDACETGILAVPQEIRRRLSREEKVLWHGQPRPGVRFRAEDLAYIPLVLTCYIWTFGPLWVIAPFIFIIGTAQLLIARFWIDPAHRAKTHYAITQRRLLIKFGASQRPLSLMLDSIDYFWFTDRADGSGTLVLALSPFPYHHFCEPSIFPGFGRYRYMPCEDYLRLERIENVRDVYRLIRAQKTRDNQFAVHGAA